MAEIPDDLIGQLQAALSALAEAPKDVSDPISEHVGREASMALDDLLAVSYQIVEAADPLLDIRPAA